MRSIHRTYLTETVPGRSMDRPAEPRSAHGEVTTVAERRGKSGGRLDHTSPRGRGGWAPGEAVDTVNAIGRPNLSVRARDASHGHNGAFDRDLKRYRRPVREGEIGRCPDAQIRLLSGSRPMTTGTRVRVVRLRACQDHLDGVFAIVAKPLQRSVHEREDHIAKKAVRRMDQPDSLAVQGPRPGQVGREI